MWVVEFTALRLLFSFVDEELMCPGFGALTSEIGEATGPFKLHKCIMHLVQIVMFMIIYGSLLF